MPATQRSAGPRTRATGVYLGRLYSTLAALGGDTVSMKAFLMALLTPAERTVFAKRWATVWMLAEGRTFADIQKRLVMAPATITHANRILTGEGTGKGFRIALEARAGARDRSSARRRAGR